MKEINTALQKCKQNAKELRLQVSAAKREISGANKSPLYVLHTLNKCARTGKNAAALDVDFAALHDVYVAVNKVTAKGFTFAVLPQNSRGEICRIKPLTDKVRANWRAGYETRVTFCGDYVLQPVATTANGILGAVASYMQYRARVECDLTTEKVRAIVCTTHTELFTAHKRGQIDDVTFIQAFEEIARGNVYTIQLAV